MTWQVIPLGRVATDVQPGFACQPTAADEGIPQLRTNNVSPQGTIDLSEVKRVPATGSQTERYLLKRGDILFNNTNSPALVGKTAYFDEEGQFLFSNHMTRVRVDSRVADPRFVARFLHWSWSRGVLRGLVTQWVNQAAINRSQLASVLVPTPPLSEQRRIVEILDQADRLRRLRAEVDAQADRISPALFIKMFGDPATNPKGWTDKPLGEITVHLTSGSRGWARYTGRGSALFLRTQDILDGEISSGLLSVDPPQGAEAERTRLQDGDVAVTITGIVGKAATFRALDREVYVSQHVALVRPDREQLHPDFLTSYANLPLGKVPVLARFQYGQTKPGLGFRELTTSRIPVPPIDLQIEFAARLDALRAIRLARACAVTKIRSLWQHLQRRAFAGLLTASWREAHMTELLQEMEQQATALAAPLWPQ